MTEEELIKDINIMRDLFKKEAEYKLTQVEKWLKYNWVTINNINKYKLYYLCNNKIIHLYKARWKNAKKTISTLILN